MRDIVIVVVAVLLGSFVKGVTGSGLPVVAVPVMATFIGVEEAVVIMVIPGIVSNLQIIRGNLDDLSRTSHLPAIVASGVGGVAVGTYLLTTVDEAALSVVLAGVIGIYLAMRLLHPSFVIDGRTRSMTVGPVGFLAGVLQGGTGVSSPIVAPYIHAFRLSRGAYVISITVVFLAFAVIQMVALFVAGVFTAERLLLGVAMVAPVIVGVAAGMRYGRRLSRVAFDRWVLIMLAATALKLVVDAAG
jgi:hypothetical protein